MSLCERFEALADSMLQCERVDAPLFQRLALALASGEELHDAQVVELADVAAKLARAFEAVSLQCRLELAERRIGMGGFDG